MRVSASLVSPPQPRRRADVLPERVWRHQQLLARRLRRGATPLSQPCASCAPICAHFRTRPTLVGEDRPFSASRASSGASLSSDGASPMLPPAPASQPARGRHRRPHGLTLVVGAVFLRALRRYGAQWNDFTGIAPWRNQNPFPKLIKKSGKNTTPLWGHFL